MTNFILLQTSARPESRAAVDRGNLSESEAVALFRSKKWSASDCLVVQGKKSGSWSNQ